MRSRQILLFIALIGVFIIASPGKAQSVPWGCADPNGCGGGGGTSSTSHHQTAAEAERENEYYRKLAHHKFLMIIKELQSKARMRIKQGNYEMAMTDLNDAMHRLQENYNFHTRQDFKNEDMIYEGKVQKEINEINAKWNAKQQAQQQKLAIQQQVSSQNNLNDTPSTFVKDNSGTAMDQLKSAAGDNANVRIPSVTSSCVAERIGNGNWEACGLPASLLSNKPALEKFKKDGQQLHKMKKEEDELNKRMSVIKTEMANHPERVGKLTNEYSKVSSVEVNVHYQETQVQEKMNNFLVQFEEQDKAEAKKVTP